jgi:3-oxoacyl-[acyl-carrier-protein] synthase III
VAAFATHQPNPRLVALLAKKSGVPLERFSMIADTRGNLGSTTCAAALHLALEGFRATVARPLGPIFVASLGPGLLFGGGWLAPISVADSGRDFDFEAAGNPYQGRKDG